jgi:peptidoglycan/xylan/chitin deacetylase (PgdA/CDA1 family)
VTPPELDRTEPLQSVRITQVRDLPHLAWAEGLSFRLPVSLLPRVRTSSSDLILSPELSRPLPAASEALRLRAAFTERRPLSSRLPFSYQLIPGSLRSLLATFLGRWQRRQQERWAAFPGWPLDLSSDLLADWACERPSLWVAGPTPVVVTHDLDSAEGLTNLVRCFLRAEEEVGACSTNFIVPCAWPIDRALLNEVRQRGHEIGIHGYDHSNRTAFLPAEQQAERLQAGAAVGRSYGACGYRAPSLLRTPGLLARLARHYAYDSSLPTSGGLFPVPNNGCASARPFPLGGLIELPLSLPRDGSLLFLGYGPEEIAELWLSCAGQIHRSGGVVVLLTHCEQRFSGRASMLAAYRRFLDAVAADRRFCFRTAAQVAREARSPALPAA